MFAMEPTKKRHTLQAIKKFGEETTIHGVFILAKYKLHVLERVFWVAIIALAAGCSVALCLSNWRRYSANPTVMSLQKDFRNWNNPFPAASGCLYDKVDETLASEYIEKIWNVNYTHDKYDYYMRFIKAVANISYQSLEVFASFQSDATLKDVDMMVLSAKVHPMLKGTLITFDTKHKTEWKMVITEMGICFTVNSQFSDVISFRMSDDGKEIDVDLGQSVLRCHYLNGLCYARYDSDPDSPVKFYIHSPLDVLHATIDAPWFVGESQELEINYRMQETVSDSNLRSLSPAQRRCRFEDEPVSNDAPYYSTSICNMVCRYRLVMKFCGCRPYFYHNFGGKICDVEGLGCVAKHASDLTRPATENGCVCPQPCNIITYTPQVPKITFWEYGYFDQKLTFRWGLLPPTTRYRRDILFGFEDLVVSFGGTVALFLGISFISVIEVIFFALETVFYFCFPSGRDKVNDVERRR